MPIVDASDVYRFVDQLQAACKQKGAIQLDIRLGNALRLGSSGVEILGAIRKTIIENRKEVEGLLEPEQLSEVAAVIGFVNKAYGR